MSKPTRARVQTFTALVLAGSRGGDDPVARACGIRHKCLAPVAGAPMLARVLAALAASASIGRILVSLEESALVDGLLASAGRQDDSRWRALPSAATPSLSVLEGLGHVADGLPVLVTTADHPLLTAEIVDWFAAAALDTDADVVAGLIDARVIRATYPESQRTYLRFRDGHYSGANLFAILTPDGRRVVAFWRRVEQDRKRPWRVVRAFGIGSLLAYLLGRLTLDGAMARASAIIGARVAAVRLPFANAAIDVDKLADLELADRILAGRG